MEALRSVAAAPPQLNPERVARTLSRDFGLEGELQALVSERDQNFRLTAADESRFVVKIVSSVETQATTDLQIAALLHLEEKGVAGVPRIVRTSTGQTRSMISDDDDSEYSLRVVSWVAGTPLESEKMSVPLAQEFGASLAQMDRALAEFGRRAKNPVLLWDTQRAPELLELTRHIDDPAMRKAVEQVLTDFRDRAANILQELAQQLIHNDANPSNVLVSGDGTTIAFIDFGDLLFAARTIEVATAASYLRSARGDPLQFIAPFVAAYHANNRLTQPELALLFDLIRTRLAMTISILFWRISARDAGDAYRQQTLRSEKNAIDFLLTLTEMGREPFLEQLNRALL